MSTVVNIDGVPGASAGRVTQLRVVRSEWTKLRSRPVDALVAR